MHLQQKRAILDGCRLVFSGVFPIVGPQSHESHYLWRLAVDLGATPSMTLAEFPLTHLVIHPERLGTQKHVQVGTASCNSVAFVVGADPWCCGLLAGEKDTRSVHCDPRVDP
jgi:hypothetical protein